MALSFRERNQIRSAISDYLAQLDRQNLTFKEKSAIRRQIAEALAKLNEQIDLKPEAAQQNQDLADLIAGKFLNEPPEVFIKILDRIYRQINDIEPLKDPTIQYIEKNTQSQQQAA